MLSLGTTIALLVGETSGLALTDLSNAPVRTTASGANGEIMYAALDQPAGIYRSDNHGRTWQLAGPGPETTITVLAVHPLNRAVLFAGSTGGPVATTNNLWRSEDGGQSWRKFFLSLPAHPDGLLPAVTALVVDPNQPEVLYVATEQQGIYRFDVGADGHGYSLMGGVSFHNIHLKSLEVGADSQVYALTEDGLFVSNEGDTWQKLSLPPDAPLDLAVAVTGPQALYVITLSGKVYRSLDMGQSWEQTSGGGWIMPDATLLDTALTVDQQDARHVAISTVYEVNGDWVRGSVYETQDAGQNWAKLADATDVITDLRIDNGVIYAATSKGLVKYGWGEKTETANFFSSIESLTHLTLTQILILGVTVGLAGLILLGRVEWIRSLK
jgi:photosystem II stability/assembly factor-like uncharacterized protein